MNDRNEFDVELFSVNRYLSAVAVCNSLALLASQASLAIFLRRLSLLKKIQKLWSHGNDVELSFDENLDVDSGDEHPVINELKSETEDFQSVDLNEDKVLTDNCTLQAVKEELQENILRVVDLATVEKSASDEAPTSTQSRQQRSSSVKSQKRNIVKCAKNSSVSPAIVSSDIDFNDTSSSISAECSTTVVESTSRKRCSELNFICTDCSLNLRTYAELKSHRMEKHAASYEDSTLVQTTEGQKLSNHAKYRKPYDQRRHICYVCKKRFQNKCELRDHLKIHTGEKPFMCNMCGRCFRLKSVLTEHMKIHLGDKRHSCIECGKSFVQSSGLKDHYVGVHSKLRVHVCNVCGKDFFRITLLKYHMRKHTGEKPYSCSVCGKKFALSRNLRKHVAVHGDEYPFQCNICSKKFKQKGGLNRHMRLHMDVKPFGCTFCSRTFTQAGNMKIHMRTHTGEKPYVCSVCGQKFSHQPTLKKHLETVHKTML